ncbi:MAG: hypothetical protein OHK0015_24160 [Chloroflexi bacterium OHK40]
MAPAEPGAIERQRLLEGWLPLAQEANTQYGWALEALALEILVLQAAPALAMARTSFEARAILWSIYQLQHEQTHE